MQRPSPRCPSTHAVRSKSPPPFPLHLSLVTRARRTTAAVYTRRRQQAQTLAGQPRVGPVATPAPLQRQWWRAVMREGARHGEGRRGAAGAAARGTGGGGGCGGRRWKKVQRMPQVRAAAMRCRAPARRRRHALGPVLASALRRAQPPRGATGYPGRRARRSARIARSRPRSVLKIVQFLNLVSWCGRYEQ